MKRIAKQAKRPLYFHWKKRYISTGDCYYETKVRDLFAEDESYRYSPFSTSDYRYFPFSASVWFSWDGGKGNHPLGECRSIEEADEKAFAHFAESHPLIALATTRENPRKPRKWPRGILTWERSETYSYIWRTAAVPLLEYAHYTVTEPKKYSVGSSSTVMLSLGSDNVYIGRTDSLKEGMTLAERDFLQRFPLIALAAKK